MKTIFKFLLFLFALMPMALLAQSKTELPKASTAKKPIKKVPVKKKTQTSTTTNNHTKEAPPVNTTGGMPVMTFKAKTTNFNKVKTGDKPSFTYEFTNTGNAPLDIEICTGCECTEIEWTQTTVQPGEKGFVKATFNTVKAEQADHKKQLKKYVDIILKQTHPKNGYPLVESVNFDVFIID